MLASSIVEFIWLLVKGIFYFCIAWVAITYVFRRFATFGYIAERWHHTFPNTKLSNVQFYEAVKNAMNEKGVKINTLELSFAENRFSPMTRNYLRVTKGNQMVLICLAPYGVDTFVSWWSGTVNEILRDIISRIPFIGMRMVLFFYHKTFYEMDTDTMFRDMVTNAVKDVISNMADTHGLRGLSELQRPTRIAATM